MDLEPTIFIKEHREYDPRYYPFQEAPDIVIYCRREMTYREYLENRMFHRRLMLANPSPREKRRKLDPASPSRVALTTSVRKASPPPERAMVPPTISQALIL